MSELRKKHSGILKPKTPKKEELEKLIDETLQTSEGDDEALLKVANLKWSELDTLRNSLSVEVSKVVEFLAVAESKRSDISELLADQLPIFDNVINTLKIDTDAFIKTLDQTSRKHEGRTGEVTTMEDYGIYQNLGMKYTIALNEYVDLVGLSMASLEAIFNTLDAKKESLNGQSE